MIYFQSNSNHSINVSRLAKIRKKYGFTNILNWMLACSFFFFFFFLLLLLLLLLFFSFFFFFHSVALNRVFFHSLTDFSI